MLIIAGLTFIALTGCQKQDELSDTLITEPEKDFVLVDLALSLPSSSAGTRQAEGVVQTEGSVFRGINKLSVIPFSTHQKVEKGDVPIYYETGNSYPTILAGSSATERYMYYDKFYLGRGVGSFLTYGQASKDLPTPLPAGVTSQAFYGSLMTNIEGEESVGIPDRLVVTPSNLTFELEPIYKKAEAHPEAILIGSYLTKIANTKALDNSWSWKDTSDPQLKTVYENFINLRNGKYHVLAGSAANVKAHVNQLKKKLETLAREYAVNSEEALIIENVLSNLTGYVTELDGYRIAVQLGADGSIELNGCNKFPGDLGLPDGAAVLLWAKIAPDSDDYAFIPQIEPQLEMEDICSIKRYAYPAELYYCGNSTIRTFNNAIASSAYAGKTWPQVLELYSSGTTVTSNTKAVAIEETMQYAVAHLSAKVYADDSELDDADGTHVPVTENGFRITGIIIGGQNPVGFDFKPETADNGVDRERFIYDSYLKSGGNDVFLNTELSGEIHTLVLQNKERENVPIILELMNDNQDFDGESGKVYKGTKFYLAGKVELNKVNQADENYESLDDDTKSRVFTQDYTTAIKMKVETLAHAYNVMPNIQAERLEVSVKIDLDWEQSTPDTFEIE